MMGVRPDPRRTGRVRSQWTVVRGQPVHARIATDLAVPVVSDSMIAAATVRGGMLLFGLGLIILELNEVRVANVPPALLFAPVVVAVASRWLLQGPPDRCRVHACPAATTDQGVPATSSGGTCVAMARSRSRLCPSLNGARHGAEARHESGKRHESISHMKGNEMTPQELAQELALPGAQEMLRSGDPARLAYNGHDGFPRVIPVGFYWNGDRIIVCTVPTSPKVRALSSRPQVALTLDSGSEPGTAKSLLVRGVATVETVDGVAEEYLAAAAKSMDSAKLKEFEQAVRALYTQMARISIEPTWARFFDFGAGRLPGFLSNLMSGSESASATHTPRAG